MTLDRMTVTRYECVRCGEEHFSEGVHRIPDAKLNDDGEPVEGLVCRPCIPPEWRKQRYLDWKDAECFVCEAVIPEYDTLFTSLEALEEHGLPVPERVCKDCWPDKWDWTMSSRWGSK